jgi:hypothetical protein
VDVSVGKSFILLLVCRAFLTCFKRGNGNLDDAYIERVSRVENQNIARLRDRLGTARNANEMFRVFSKFNVLFVPPKVWKAYVLSIPLF